MTRYAIYYMPRAETPLARFGASFLGYDAAMGAEVEPLDHPVFHDPAALGWTAAPRRYGFHATLKAPFTLAHGRTAAELEEALAGFVAAQRSFRFSLTLGLIRQFLALIPAMPCREIDDLAATCVKHFDLFRAPLTPEDRERRNPNQLTAEQVINLDTWGYPFVLDDFQFHMTLTGALEPRDRARLEPILRAILAETPLEITVDSVVLCLQEGPNARFVLQRRFEFPPH